MKPPVWTVCIACTVVFTLACDREHADAPTTESPCTRRINEMEYRFRQSPRGVSRFIEFAWDVELAPIPTGLAVEDGGEDVAVTHSGEWRTRDGVLSPEEALGWADTDTNSESATRRSLVVYLDRRARVGGVFPILAHWNAVANVRILVRATSVDAALRPPAPPARAARVLRATRASTDASRAIELILAGFTRAIAACPSGERALDAAALASFESRGRVLREGVVAALRECECNAADVDEIESLVNAMVGSADMRWVSLNLAGPGEEPVRRIEIAPTATLQELLTALRAEPEHAVVEITAADAPPP